MWKLSSIWLIIQIRIITFKKYKIHYIFVQSNNALEVTNFSFWEKVCQTLYGYFVFWKDFNYQTWYRIIAILMWTSDISPFIPPLIIVGTSVVGSAPTGLGSVNGGKIRWQNPGSFPQKPEQVERLFKKSFIWALRS